MPETENNQLKTDGRIKIVVAEDDKFLSRALADKLARSGIEVIRALDGQQAVDKIKAELPNLVLLDLMMPQKSGFEVLAEMKLDKTLSQIPVIVLSNLGQETDIKKAKDLGAVDYLVKSNVQIKKAVEKIKEYLISQK